ncbi:MAG: hypothetical protein M0Z85_02915 [Gammaproteobacteria bacterium]|jgi:hypothetical protein|nr:hypothetical protein [Gammaproteobacteria bacterium]
MRQGRPVEFPDVNHRSVYKPHVLVERDDVLAIYNQEHQDSQVKNVSENVKTWFIEEAHKNGWSTATFVESNAVLGAEVTVNKPS